MLAKKGNKFISVCDSCGRRIDEDWKGCSNVETCAECLDNSYGVFSVLKIDRGDINAVGYNSDKMSDEQMRGFAKIVSNKMLSGYYWEAVKETAEDLSLSHI